MKGFQLLEMLIALVIIGLLAAISIPLYSDYLIKQNRQEAESALMRLSLALEEYFSEHNTYLNANLENLGFGHTIARNHYSLEITHLTETDYFITAQPIGNQSAQDARCGTLGLRASGEKSITGAENIERCW